MELELGLKITQTRGDISSTADLHIAKDAGGVVFLSRETENTFILTAHLKGYRREHIDIKINEDGTHITISANKAVQEKVMLGWILYKKEVELRGFRKTFKIPAGVVLDKIQAKFDEDGAILTIFMPKMVQGVSGHVIEEVGELEDDQGRMTKTDFKETEEEHKDSATKKMKGVEGDKEGGDNGRELQAQVAAVAPASKAKQKEPFEEDTEEAQIRKREEGVTKQEEMSNEGIAKKDNLGKVFPEKLEETKKEAPESMPTISNQQMAFDHEKENSGVIEKPQTKYPRDEVEQQTKEEAEEAVREGELPHTSAASQQLPTKGPMPRPLQKQETKMEAQLTKSEDNQQPGKAENLCSKQIASLDSELREGESLREEETSNVENEIQSEYPEDDKHRDVSENIGSGKSKPEKSKKICVPVVAGSALLVSLIVLVIHLIRAKR